MQFDAIESLVEDLALGKMIILVDDESRENEGDLILASDHVTPEAINFMAQYARGLICVTLTRERCQQLNLPLMVAANKSSMSTAFTVSIEAASGVTTGISVSDRAKTIEVAVNKESQPGDLVSPGHIFPVQAVEGGVLSRPGHTEAGCDLACLAGCSPSAVIVEILNPDGSMARRPDLMQFAEQHNLKIGSIEALIEFRNRANV